MGQGSHPRAKAQRRRETSRINRTAWGGEKPAPPSLKTVAIGTKNIYYYLYICHLLKKEIKPPWHLVVDFLKMR